MGRPVSWRRSAGSRWTGRHAQWWGRSTAAIGPSVLAASFSWRSASSGWGCCWALTGSWPQSFGAGPLDVASTGWPGCIPCADFRRCRSRCLCVGISGHPALSGVECGCARHGVAGTERVTLSVTPLLLYAAFRRICKRSTSCGRYLRPAVGESREHRRELGADLRQVRLPALGATGAAWATVFSARVHGGGVGSWRSERPGAGGPAAEAERARDWTALRRLIRGSAVPRPSDPAGGGRVRHGHRASRAGSPPAGAAAASDRAETSGRSVHGALGLMRPGPVRVGRRSAAGTAKASGARRWTALALAGLVTRLRSVVFWWRPARSSGFSQDATVLAIGPVTAGIAGVCLVFDGTQGVATGILRGLGETRVPMVANFAGHWPRRASARYAACFWWDGGCKACGSGRGRADRCRIGVARHVGNRRARRALPDRPAGPPVTLTRGAGAASDASDHSRVSVLTFTFSPSLTEERDAPPRLPVSSFATFVTFPDAVSPRPGFRGGHGQLDVLRQVEGRSRGR